MVVVCVGLGGAKRHHYKHIITMTFDQDNVKAKWFLLHVIGMTLCIVECTWSSMSHMCVCVACACWYLHGLARQDGKNILRSRLRFFQFRACAFGVWMSAFTFLNTFLARLFTWILFHRKISRCWRGACTSWSLHTFKHMVKWVKIAT